mmetsp:Transcript_44937/g.116832  ORF Transcript_44937/g.116832 Transcript_44937/m.116832 type:complete len:344 (-) Transcript_44937:736-1767(-)
MESGHLLPAAPKRCPRLRAVPHPAASLGRPDPGLLVRPALPLPAALAGRALASRALACRALAGGALADCAHSLGLLPILPLPLPLVAVLLLLAAVLDGDLQHCGLIAYVDAQAAVSPRLLGDHDEDLVTLHLLRQHGHQLALAVDVDDILHQVHDGLHSLHPEALRGQSLLEVLLVVEIQMVQVNARTGLVLGVTLERVCELMELESEGHQRPIGGSEEVTQGHTPADVSDIVTLEHIDVFDIDLWLLGLLLLLLGLDLWRLLLLLFLLLLLLSLLFLLFLLLLICLGLGLCSCGLRRLLLLFRLLRRLVRELLRFERLVFVDGRAPVLHGLVESLLLGEEPR